MLTQDEPWPWSSSPPCTGLLVSNPVPLLCGSVAGVKCHRAGGSCWLHLVCKVYRACVLPLLLAAIRCNGQEGVQTAWFSVVWCLVGKGDKSAELMKGFINLGDWVFMYTVCVKL